MSAQRQEVGIIRSSFTPVPSGLLQRKCNCGNHTVAGGECTQCSKKKSLPPDRERLTPRNDLSRQSSDRETFGFKASRFGRNFSQVNARDGIPTKARGVFPEDREKAKPSPTQGSATIKCDGSGGYEIVYGAWAGTACGTKDCVTAHESSHMADWKAKWPTGCQGQPKGYLPKGDPPDNPLMTVAEYDAFLKKSECKAHTVDLACAEALPRSKGCEKTIDDYITLTRAQKANWCPGLSRGAKVAIGIGGGALAGAGIGFLAGGPLGAAIGAGLGALVGGIAGAFF